MPLKITLTKVRPIAGMRVDYQIADAIILANKTNAPVEMDFNHFKLTVSPNELLDRAQARYSSEYAATYRREKDGA